MESNIRKKVAIILIILIVLILIGVISVCLWYNNNLKPVSKENPEKNLIRVEIEEGMGTTQIASLLQENNVIKNATVMKIYSKLNNISTLKAGKYDFDNSENLEQIISQIVNGEVANEEVKITFIEGKNMRWIAKAIAEKTNNTEDDVFNLLKDEEYIDSLVEKYWFITEEVKDDDIYYPLEGYLLPDTYVFENEDVSVKQIFNIILNFTENI